MGHEQIGSLIYNSVATVIGAEGISSLVQGLANHNIHTVKDAAAGLAISALFLTGNAIVGMKQDAPPASSSRKPGPKSGLTVLSLQ